jgi:hypothetical protein
LKCEHFAIDEKGGTDGFTGHAIPGLMLSTSLECYQNISSDSYLLRLSMCAIFISLQYFSMDSVPLATSNFYKSFQDSKT